MYLLSFNLVETAELNDFLKGSHKVGFSHPSYSDKMFLLNPKPSHCARVIIYKLNCHSGGNVTDTGRWILIKINGDLQNRLKKAGVRHLSLMQQGAIDSWNALRKWLKYWNSFMIIWNIYQKTVNWNRNLFFRNSIFPFLSTKPNLSTQEQCSCM